MTRVMRSLSDITELPLPNAIVFFLISTFDERRTYAIYWVGVELIFIRVLILPTSTSPIQNDLPT